MHRAWKRSVGALGLVAVTLAAPAAWAFHNGNLFDKAPGAGGGGGIFYTGAPRAHGWNCTMCHEKPAGKIKVRLNVEPKELFDGFNYVPDQIYTFTATMEGEHLGLETPLYNFNSLAVEFVDKDGFLVGNITGIAPDPEGHTDFYGGGGQTQIASTGIKTGVTSWSFKWQAGNPEFGPAKGPVTMYVAAVDGDGGYTDDPKATDPDPFNDDVFVADIHFTEGATARRMPDRPGTLVCLLGVALASVVQRRKRALKAPTASA